MAEASQARGAASVGGLFAVPITFRLLNRVRGAEAVLAGWVFEIQVMILMAAVFLKALPFVFFPISTLLGHVRLCTCTGRVKPPI
jgi:hypothetical protein